MHKNPDIYVYVYQGKIKKEAESWLSDQLSAIFKTSITLAHRSNHEPYIVEHPSFCLTKSDCDDFIVYALSKHRIAIDLERLRQPNAYIGKQYYTKKEYDACRKDEALWTKLWTMKEAYSKYIGKGLSCLRYQGKNIEDLCIEKKLVCYDLTISEDMRCSLLSEKEARIQKKTHL